MPVPQEVMQQAMQGEQMPPTPQGGAPAGGAGPSSSPAAAPLNQPQEKAGLRAAAQTNVHIAVNMLEEALPAFGTESKEGLAILKALSGLGKLIAKKDSSDLVPAEVLHMVRQLPQAGGGTDIQKMLLQQMNGGGQKPPQPQPPQGV